MRWARWRGRATPVVLVFGGSLLVAGCGSEPPPAAPAAPVPRAAPEVTPVSSVKERGPVTFIVTVADDDVRVGDTVDLTIEMIAQGDATVGMPELEDAVGGFQVDSSTTPPDVPITGGARRTTHRYALYSFEPGAHEIPALTATFVDPKRSGDLEQELTSDALVVEVRSATDPEADPTAIRALRAPEDVPVPTDWTSVGLMAGGAVATLLLAALIAALVRRRAAARRALPPPPVPPHIRAREALRELEASGRLERGELHGFYVCLSDIVRVYLEGRFDLHAPEQTTEEFLRGAERNELLSIGHRALLANFLRAADMVKFARFNPTPDEGRDALAKAHAFVDETAPLGDPVR